MTYFIGCIHFGHESMAKYRGFYDSWEHDEHLIRCWNSVVKEKDKVFILGDITMEKAIHYPKLEELNGYKHVVLGNHDRPQDIDRMLDFVDKVSGVFNYNGYMLTHVPIHPNEVTWCKGNIHAHIHHKNVIDSVEVYDRYQDEGSKLVTVGQEKYINVDAHLLNYKPISFAEIESRNVQNS